MKDYWTDREMWFLLGMLIAGIVGTYLYKNFA